MISKKFLGIDTLRRLRAQTSYQYLKARVEKHAPKPVYLSFFGEVMGKSPLDQLKRVTDALAQFERERWDCDHEDDCDCWNRGRIPVQDPRPWLPEPLRIVELTTVSDGVNAVAYVYYGKQAVVIVDCPAGCWTEWAVVEWPLRATGPAQIAGACCNPRYPGSRK